ncbi:resolvase [Candidatus Epulonipiscium fishelsonii]|uniref:Resolvase n=1 Tax=Candidatus Epulonipiscium fishelsonii TaxID=77094 RepID=A0ACC8XB01_9FIRM|nr:resolvase [Epulopiscium sp. SCG-D08WGA-EpuloA1]
MANIAYIRVSTIEQNEERQEESLRKRNIKIDKKFIEKVSAKDTNRLELQEMLEYIREGDVVYIDDFSRLARSTKDLLELVELLEKKKVVLVSLKENIDTSTAQGKLMLTMLGAINEFERQNMLERQREGIAIAKAQGKYKGREKVPYPNNWESVYKDWRERKIKSKEAMEILGLKKTTFYKLKEEYEKKLIEP